MTQDPKQEFSTSNEFPSGSACVQWIQENEGNQIRASDIVLGDLHIEAAGGGVQGTVNGDETFSVNVLEVGGLVVRETVGVLIAEPREQYLSGVPQ